MEFNSNSSNKNNITLPMYIQYKNPAPGHESDDNFLMYTYKVRRCSKTRSHDWTECPYAHRGEKARRRDPRKFPYTGVACAEFRQSGECRRGQNCEFAHGVFEFWLHPSRYRTRICEAGMLCPRKICFFAHSPEQLRPEVVHDCARCGGHGARAVGGGLEGAKEVVATFAAASSAAAADVACCVNAGGSGAEGGVGEEPFELPDIEWIVDLVS